MLYTEETVRQNIRNREGARVFFLGKGDTLTPGARDFLTRERIRVLPGESARPTEYRLPNGAVLSRKPEQLTHLNGDILVPKTHPRIAFRGAMDTLEAELMLCQLNVTEPLRRSLGEILSLARMLIRCEVMDEPVPEGTLCGLTPEEQQSRSHRPQDYYGQAHFMPEYTDGGAILWLNRCRCAARSAELIAARAFTDPEGRATREDILRALNRMSSMIYILMIQTKAGKL
ncbi:MAG: ATP-binding protein [Oscillospiraceae bacterium]|nr:ATP-binding protein [Oscillospiraceae bacterium]